MRWAGAGFALEALECLGVHRSGAPLPVIPQLLVILSGAKDLLGQELQRHLAAELGVLGLVDDAHAADSQLFQNAVVGNDVTNHGCRSGVAVKIAEAILGQR